MKIIIKISKIIFIVSCIFILSFTLVALTTKYDNKKVCRNKEEVNISNYQNISNVVNIEILSNCDKCRLYINLDEEVKTENINGVILQIVNRKKQYNDNSKLEIILVNSQLNYIVFIDEEERIDIDYAK